MTNKLSVGIDVTINNETLVPDHEIEDAFKNTNFGRTDYKNILLEGVKKTAIGYHNGWTLTQIIRKLGLGVATSDNENNKLTEKGLLFIEQAASNHAIALTESLNKNYETINSGLQGYVKVLRNAVDCAYIGTEGWEDVAIEALAKTLRYIPLSHPERS
ncbi:MAG TPA: hypothetical protein VIO56_03140 [Methylotenera sp.]